MITKLGSRSPAHMELPLGSLQSELPTYWNSSVVATLGVPRIWRSSYVDF